MDIGIFLATCSMLASITGDENICVGVEPPTVVEIEDWAHLGNYFFEDGSIIIRKNAEQGTKERVTAHETAHHILHVKGIAPVDKDVKMVCVSEVYAHEVTQLYADMNGQIPSPGETKWLPRYPHCWDYVVDTHE